ncbi:siroheme synthase CysG [Ahrensia marina]|uniref:Uroporphyrin-III methyltransferase n=1 Tax=Ahrensia marina TaxID=1514904 RepID=A0A0M9GMT7_9HYPH|nr:siroheme synthase CysG [Ahrensia marina]KPB01189.1 uroporphyrin-III methyltransferase [Ahrensia marina]
MRHFPVFLNVADRRVIVSGAGECAIAKLRLLLKTEANIFVYGTNAETQVRVWSAEGKLTLVERALKAGDADEAAMLYAANEDDVEDARVAQIGRDAGALTNIVDNLEDSQFITPAIVDRDPVTIAIGTEGAAPVLARRIKADIESRLPASLGILARIGQAFRGRADMLPQGRIRRDFWSRYYEGAGDAALQAGGEKAVNETLNDLLTDAIETRPREGHVSLIGTGPGDPDLLTLKARRLLHEADVVLHDQLVPQAILELARREAIVIEVGKKGYGPSWKQEDINALMIKHAKKGAQIARLKSGDPAIFGRLDEELDALDEAAIAFDIVPGITSASAAAATIGISLTRRGRNSSLRIITGRETQGFAEHEWRELAKEGSAAAIYMGLRAASFLRGRLLMHGASADTPVTAVENVSRSNQKIISTTLAELPDALNAASITGPAVLLYGLSPRDAVAASTALETTPELYTAGAL